jgi:hypothetical protein
MEMATIADSGAITDRINYVAEMSDPETWRAQ